MSIKETPTAVTSVLEMPARSIFVSAKSDAGAKPTNLIQEDEFGLSNHDKIEPWGLDNMEPHHLIRDAKANPTLGTALNWIVRALYSGGLEYGTAEGDDFEGFKTQKIPEIETLLKRSNAKRQLIKGLLSLKQTGNCFPEVILSKDRKKIVMFGFNDATHGRWGYEKRNGLSKYCYLSANWYSQNGLFQKKYTERVAVLDNSFDQVQALRDGKDFKYILPDVNFPTLGNSYYAEPIWNSLRTSKWLEYANMIPAFKRNYLKNATHIKYVIHIPESWWIWKYKDFATNDKERPKRIKKEHERFEKFVGGFENAGKSLILTFQNDPAYAANNWAQWKIELIDKKVIDNILGGDLLDITQIIYQSVGVHATLLGGAPGSTNLGAGSGSDQKQAYNIFMALSTFDQETVMTPLQLMAEYNGHPNLKFRFNSRMIADLSSVTPDKRVAQEA
jgi:hypothetical protein